MKKMIGLCMMAMLLLSGCAMGASKNSALLQQDGHYDIEDEASITVHMEDEDYAQALRHLWDTTYPTHKGALHITIGTYQKGSALQQDVTWLSEGDMERRKAELYDMEGLKEHIQVQVPSQLNRDEQTYLPMVGKGLIFMYNETTLKERGGDIEDMKSFERMKDLGEDVYYHNRMEDYVYPFLFTPHEEEGKAWLKEDAFFANLMRYRNLNQELGLMEDTQARNEFYEGSYVCGLVMNDGSYMEKEVYKKGDLHATVMPSYQGVSYMPIVDTYGFVVSKDTRYPAACMAFLQMVRSEVGLQALVDTTRYTPLMEQEETEEFAIFDSTRKEIIIAVNGSQLRDLSMQAYVKGSGFYSQIENSLYTKESDKQILKKIMKEGY